MRKQRNCHACGQCINCSQEYHTILNKYGSLQPTIVCHREYPIDPEKENMHGLEMEIGGREIRDEFYIRTVDFVYVIGSPFVSFYLHTTPIDEGMELYEINYTPPNPDWNYTQE